MGKSMTTAGVATVDNGNTGRYRWYVLGVMFLATLLAYLDRQVMSVLVVPMQKSLAISDVSTSLLLGPAFMVLYAAAGIPMGYLADRYSRRNLLAAGITIWSLATIAGGYASSYEMLIFTRAAVGLGEACVIPTVFSLVADYFKPEMRGRANSVVSLGFPFGSSLALFGGGFILRSLGEGAGGRAAWQIVLIVFGLLGLLIAALTLSVREPTRTIATSSNAPRSASTGFLAHVLRHRWALLLVLTPYVLLAYMQNALIAWIPTLLARRYGLAAADAGILYGSITLTTVPLSILLGGVLADRLAIKRPDGRFVLMGLAAPWFFPGVLALTSGHSVALAGVGLVLICVVGGIVSTTVYAAVQEITPMRLRGQTLALYALSANLIGLAIGPLITAFITDDWFGDKDKLHLSMIIATAPAWIITLLCAWFGLGHYRALRKLVGDATN